MNFSPLRSLAALAAATLLAACGAEPPASSSTLVAPEPGMLLLATDPGEANILINGELRGVTPADPGQTLTIRLAPGTYHVEARKAVDEFVELVASREGLEVGDKALPAIGLRLERRLTPAGEVRHAEMQQQLDERDRAAAARFVEAGEGVITDTSTGLTWMRCALGMTWAEGRCTGTPSRHTWANAKDVAAAHSLAGFDDWRLPTKDELLTITWCSSGQRFAPDPEGAGGACVGDFRRPTVLAEVFPDTPAGKFWTSTPGRLGFTAWGVAFTNAVTGAGNQSDREHLRLVRDTAQH